MIRLPRRSVTRFFIPLIDVLTLLFCIFLVLPLVKNPGEEADRAAQDERLRQLEREVERLRRADAEVPQALRAELEQLRQEKTRALQDRLAVRVLEIDGTTGKLYYRDPERVEIHNQAEARTLIDRDQRERQASRRELYYLILYPRDRGSSFPTRGQREQYQRWFEGVALGFDIPGAAPEGGKQP
jgi:peptidoglycan/xylan/chitin deacetylase (PgdA/CDA1 family)